jgi:hypothetical protein
MKSAPVSTADAHFTSPIAVENRRELRRKGAAETAAALGFLHLDEFKIAHVFEQFARLRFDAEFAQAVAAVVKGGLARESARRDRSRRA